MSMPALKKYYIHTHKIIFLKKITKMFYVLKILKRKKKERKMLRAAWTERKHKAGGIEYKQIHVWWALCVWWKHHGPHVMKPTREVVRRIHFWFWWTDWLIDWLFVCLFVCWLVALLLSGVHVTDWHQRTISRCQDFHCSMLVRPRLHIMHR